MSVLKTYWAWLVLAVFLAVFLFVQWWWVPAKMDEIRENNADSIQTLRGLATHKGLVRSYPTLGDLEAMRGHEELFSESVKAIRGHWRRFTDGLNAYMSNGRNPNGEVFNPVKVSGEGEPGVIIPWDTFIVTLHGLYESMFEESVKAMTEKLEPRLKRMLADQFFAADQGVTMEMAEEMAEEMAPALARQRARLVERMSTLNTINVNAPFNVVRNPSDMERGWGYWRRFLILRDLLTRVIPAVEAEIKTSLYAHTPVGIQERSEYVRDRLNDDLPPELLNTPRESWPVTEWRHIEQIMRIEISDPELGANALASDSDSEEEGSAPRVAAPGRPGGVGTARRVGRGTVPATNEGVATYFDRYKIEIDLVAHPKVLEAFQEVMLNSSKDAGMFYEPVSMSIKLFRENQTLPGLESGTAASRNRSELGGDAMSSRSFTAMPSDTDTAPLMVSASFDREPPVMATLVYRLIRFRYADTDNETLVIPEESSSSRFGPGGMGGMGGMRPAFGGSPSSGGGSDGF